MSKEKELLQAYRVLNAEGQDFILSMVNTALIAQKAALRQPSFQYSKYDIHTEAATEDKIQSVAIPIG